MASKWREFWVFDESSELKTIEQQGQCGEMYVVEKAALDDALELINEIEKIAHGMLGKNAGSIIGKIKAFKDRGSDDKS